MSKIRIKNFGPIKEGFKENDGWLNISKITLFIGNQGSGKSTIAKVISTLTWMEKGINRGDLDSNMSHHNFYHFFEYQRINNYFRDDTEIEYQGEKVYIYYNKKKLKFPKVSICDAKSYNVPKIMYVPSERNFLSVIENAFNIKRLPGPLFTFAEELRKGQIELKGKELQLPIDNLKFKYDQEEDKSILIGNGFQLNLLEASSGYQSIVPLYLVSMFLSNELKKGSKILRDQLSVTQSVRRNEEIAIIMLNEAFTDIEKKSKVKAVDSKYLNSCFVNIVEEPEQNLYPTSQWQIIKSLLEFNNLTENSKLILTTHSPYLINYLTLAVKAFNVSVKIESSLNKDELNTMLDKIVPSEVYVRPYDWVVYELNEIDGAIIKLDNFNGLPSDNNYLNLKMAEGNELFAKLLDIEDLCQ